MKNSLNKPIEYEQYYQRLGNDKSISCFESMRDVMMLAVVLGYIQNRRIPFIKPGGDAIKDHLFSQDDINIFDIIAILETKDIKILLNENKDDKYKMIEEYAHGGMQYLVENIFNGPITSPEKIVDFVMSFEPKKEKRIFDLGDLIANTVSELEKSY